MILLLALYTVAGGIHVRGNLHATPALNTGLLALGTGLASVMGTTGAAMLLIRPVLRANDNRRHQAHVVIFFIFLVANVGGGAHPSRRSAAVSGLSQGCRLLLDDQGHVLADAHGGSRAAGALLHDRHVVLCAQGRARPPQATLRRTRRYRSKARSTSCCWLESWARCSFRACGSQISRSTSTVQPSSCRTCCAIIALLAITWASWRLTPRSVRSAHHFEWAPIIEVAKLFAAIFLTIIPAIAILRAGHEGVMAPLVALVSDPAGAPNNRALFLVDRRVVQRARQCADVSRVLQSRRRRSGGADGTLGDDPYCHLGRSGLHGRA